ncbi:MAG: hypothetical protein WCB27_13105 [Thermoguttaceae bacterium]
MTATEQFIGTLQSLKSGDLGRLRKHAGLPLDESVDGFDLFSGLWWPLREKSQRAPRREVAWLIAKLFAFCQMPQCDGATLSVRLGRTRPADQRTALRWQQKFDRLLVLPLGQILQRFEIFPFSAGPTFAKACQERLAWIWQQEAGPNVPMPLGMEQMGWRNGSYSMRRAMTALGGALELRCGEEVAA